MYQNSNPERQDGESFDDYINRLIQHEQDTESNELEMIEQRYKRMSLLEEEFNKKLNSIPITGTKKTNKLRRKVWNDFLLHTIGYL